MASNKQTIKLYWVMARDHVEDWFIFAESAKSARAYHEHYEGYGAGDARARLIVRDVRLTKFTNGEPPKIEGTIKSASFHGVELSEYPGRVFHFSAVGSSMADLTTDQLGKANAMTRAEAAGLADNKLRERDVYLSTALLENSRNRHAGVVHRNRPFSPRAGPSFSPAAVPGRGFRPLP